jgi:5-(carboxyamino)imidazole ribonucleotide mutase
MSESIDRVMVVTGSINDWKIMDHCSETLAELDIFHRKVVASAHRQPQKLRAEVSEFLDQGGQVFICGAGMAAHLGGVVASLTIRPVLGVPLPGGVQDGMDSLLSMVQMPRGVPVGTLAVGKHGAINAAILAAQILALTDPELEERLKAHKASMAA